MGFSQCSWLPPLPLFVTQPNHGFITICAVPPHHYAFSPLGQPTFHSITGVHSGYPVFKPGLPSFQNIGEVVAQFAKLAMIFFHFFWFLWHGGSSIFKHFFGVCVSLWSLANLATTFFPFNSWHGGCPVIKPYFFFRLGEVVGHFANLAATFFFCSVWHGGCPVCKSGPTTFFKFIFRLGGWPVFKPGSFLIALGSGGCPPCKPGDPLFFFSWVRWMPTFQNFQSFYSYFFLSLVRWFPSIQTWAFYFIYLW